MPQKLAIPRLAQHIVSILLAIMALVIILLLAFPIGFYGMAMYISPSLPSISEIKTAKLEMPLQIYSKDNKLIGQYGNRMSLPVTSKDLPKNLINAFLAAEDSSFYEHSGISTKGLGRALTEAIKEDDGQTGGSTITMQVAKNYFLTPERTFKRKLTELYLARRIEAELSKEEILTLYVNKIYMGEGAYGIRAAAKKYYSKSLDKLTIAEMATLAGLPKAPSQNNPVSNPEEALERRNWIIGRMLKLGYITQAEHDNAIDDPIGVHVYTERLDVNMPYLAEMTRSALVDRYGSDIVNSGWRVKLTVDSEVQSAADTAVIKGLVGYDRRHGWRGAEANGEPLSKFYTHANMVPAKVTGVSYRSFTAELKNGESVTIPWSGMSWAKLYSSANRIKGYPNTASEIVKKDDIVRLIASEDGTSWRLTQIPKVQGSLVSLDPETGAVRALVGGFDFRYSKFNRATQAWRQPGSTIKPLNYSAALEKGYTPETMVSDGPLRIGSWQPKNSDGRHYGNMPLRRGLYLSRNLVSIRVLQAVGTADARQLLSQFGLVKEKLPETLALALGAAEATNLQMATAYATFANGGHRIQPYYIDQIYDYNNTLLYLANPKHACALCFNKNLDKTNAQLKEDYEKQIDADIEQRKTILQSLKEGAEELQVNTEVEESEETEDTDSDIKKVLDSKSLQATIENIGYDESPLSDRLKPTLIQFSETDQAPRILSAKSAFQMAGILRDVIQRGTGTRARSLGRSDIGGKTGTTNDYRDAWFAGFHPTLVTVVWVGFDTPSTLGRGEYGGIAALPIWIDFMGKQLKSAPKQWVSLDNKSKAEKQEQDIINLSDDNDNTTTDEKGTKTTAANSPEITNQRISTRSEIDIKPPTAAVKERQSLEPEPEESSINDSEDTAPVVLP